MTTLDRPYSVVSDMVNQGTLHTEEPDGPMKRLVLFPKRYTASALAIAICVAHLAIVAVYIFDRASSPLAYNSATVKSFIQGPVIPINHTLAAVFLVWAIFHEKSRQWAANVAWATWAGYAASLYVSAQHHTPKGALVGVALASGMFLITSIIVAAWGVDEDDRPV